MNFQWANNLIDRFFSQVLASIKRMIEDNRNPSIKLIKEKTLLSGKLRKSKDQKIAESNTKFMCVL